MIEIGVGKPSARAEVVAVPVRLSGEDKNRDRPQMAASTWSPAPDCRAEAQRYLDDLSQGRSSPGAAGAVNVLPRPGQVPGHVLLVGVGAGDEAAWRAAGAALSRAAHSRFATVTVYLPADLAEPATTAFAEAVWLASYRYRLAADHGDRAPRLRRLTLAEPAPPTRAPAPARPSTTRTSVDRARAVADAVFLARDLVNTPSLQKSPRWFADRIAAAAARRPGLAVSVRDETALAEDGFGGILAVGSGSTRPPRLLELSWRPRGARTHVVLVGKGITFDSGGISLKPPEAMKLMRKDMGGAAAVCAAVLGAADLGLPVRLTALAPLAENMVSGSSFRPGDVVRHYGGVTSEILNTDAEGRVVVADALAYAVRRLRPDLLVDLATLTGASHVALGKRTAAIFSQDPALADAITRAGAEVGELMWRLPLADAYQPLLRSEIADLNNAAPGAEAGAVTAALYLREFTGALRDRWVHIDMSAPSWIETSEGPLSKGATGWGVRTLLRWLGTL